MNLTEFLNSIENESTDSGQFPILTVYTDGACMGNPGPGGWASILMYNGKETELGGGEIYTTNNRMEMLAAIEALKVLPKKMHVKITTDSQYLKNGITLWIEKWRRNGWMTASKTAVKNEDLWRELDELVKDHQVEWLWVKGHNGHPLNERVDALAKSHVIRVQMKRARA